MAGNVSEWCWNESDGKRYIMGGDWNEPYYSFSFPNLKVPFDRSASNGFRCMKYISAEMISEKAIEQIQYIIPRDISKEKPVSDEIFRVYKGLFTYDKTELNPVIEYRDENSPHYVKEKITFKVQSVRNSFIVRQTQSLQNSGYSYMII